MYLTNYYPINMLNQFHRDLERVFGTGREVANGDSTIATSAWVPAVDIKEESNQFVIEADIPGVDPKEVDVFMENGVLTIKGERKVEKQAEKNGFKRVERLHGNFYRRFSLPETADPEKISATGKNGVLQITIPKREVAQPRRIQIQA
jgi:HSP20 family protein